MCHSQLGVLLLWQLSDTLGYTTQQPYAAANPEGALVRAPTLILNAAV